MKRITAIFCVLALMLVLFTACGKAPAAEKPAEQPAEESGEANLPNPVKETDAEGIMQTLGVEFGIPEGAEDLRYSTINDELAEMRFSLDGTEFVARIKPSAEFEDISGMYYDWTAKLDDCKVGYCDAQSMSYISETEDDVMAVLWFDAAPGLMYSLCAVGADLNGLDPLAVAEQIFVPMQGDAG